MSQKTNINDLIKTVIASSLGVALNKQLRLARVRFL